MTPRDTQRLHFRQMASTDLDNMHRLLGDPEVMQFYGSPFSLNKTQEWINENLSRYKKDGFGLWIIETHSGEFIGDCGLTWQYVDGRQQLEVAYHVLYGQQGIGYATEAATACRDYAIQKGHDSLIAVIYPGNTASENVARKIGLTTITSSTDSKGNAFSVFQPATI